VFTELRNKFRSGYILRDVLEAVDGLCLNSQAERHELCKLYETPNGVPLFAASHLVTLRHSATGFENFRTPTAPKKSFQDFISAP